MRTLFTIFLLLFSSSYGQFNDCPYGEVNCPGRCGHFVDSTGDGFCDHSKPQPISPKVENESQELAQADIQPQGQKRHGPRRYNLVPISLIFVALYSLTRLFAKFRLISLGSHRQIWNTILLIVFISCASLSIFLILYRDFGLRVTLPFNPIFWHVQTGIVLIVVGFLHTLWHWRYFARIVSYILPSKTA